MALGMAPGRALFLAFVGLSLCGACGALPARASAAQTERAVLLDSTACDVIGARELRELLALELSPRSLWTPSAAPAPRELIRATVRCNGAEAHLRVEDAALERSQELDLDLAETIVAARARLLALTLSELIATLDMQSAPQRAVPSETQTRTHPAAQFLARPGRLWLAVGMVREGTPRVLGPTLQSGLLWRLGTLPMALQSEVVGGWGQRTLSLGEVQTWNVSGSASLAYALRAAQLELLLAAGVRLGHARLEGDVRSAAPQLQAHVVSGRWWGPLLGASALLPLQRRWALRAGLDLAYVAKAVRGLDPAGGTSYALVGLSLYASLGACLSL